MNSKSTGPKLLDMNLKNISFKPPNGNLQAAKVTFSNSLTTPIAFKVVANKPNFYAIDPNTGIVHPGQKEVSFQINPSFTKEKFKSDFRNHEFHMLALKWPKHIQDYDKMEWKKLEVAHKDNLQRHVFDIDFNETSSSKKARSKSSDDESCIEKVDLIDVDPTKVTVQVGKQYPLTVSNLSSKCVAFKVQTPKGKFYVVSPNKGLILSRKFITLQVEVDKNASVKELKSDPEAQQVVILALEWPAHKQNFDQGQWTTIMKSKPKKLQKVIVNADIMEAFPGPKQPTFGQNSYYSATEMSLGQQLNNVAAFPGQLIFNGTTGQIVAITLMNMGLFPVAFKVEPVLSILWKHYVVQPKNGVVRPKNMQLIRFCPHDNIIPSELPSNPDKHVFKLRIIGWPMLIQEPREDVWKEYISNKGKVRVIAIKLFYPEAGIKKPPQNKFKKQTTVETQKILEMQDPFEDPESESKTKKEASSTEKNKKAAAKAVLASYKKLKIPNPKTSSDKHKKTRGKTGSPAPPKSPATKGAKNKKESGEPSSTDLTVSDSGTGLSPANCQREKSPESAYGPILPPKSIQQVTNPSPATTKPTPSTIPTETSDREDSARSAYGCTLNTTPKPTPQQKEEESETKSESENVGQGSSPESPDPPKEKELLFSIHPINLTYKPPYGNAKQSSVVTIRNLNEGVIAYKVQTNQKLFYTISPAKCILNPNEEQTINFELLESFSGKDEDQGEHRFQVMAFPWSKDVKEFDSNLWQELEERKIEELQTVCLDTSFC